MPQAQCRNDEMSQCHNVTMSQCHNVTMTKCHNVAMSRCHDDAILYQMSHFYDNHRNWICQYLLENPKDFRGEIYAE